MLKRKFISCKMVKLRDKPIEDPISVKLSLSVDGVFGMMWFQNLATDFLQGGGGDWRCNAKLQELCHRVV